MAKKATSKALRAAFEGHLEETLGHVERLARAAEMLETKPSGKTCKAMQGLIEEGKEVLEEDADPAVIDAALIAAARLASSTTRSRRIPATQAMAEQLGEMKIVKLLQATLEEELGADEKLSDICTREVLPATEQAAEPTAGSSTPSRRASR